MRAVWKYPLAWVPGEQDVVMPAGSAVVHVAAQHGMIAVWAEVDPKVEAIEHRYLTVVGTGSAIPEGFDHYLGTGHLPPFVLHVYEDRTRH